MVVDIPIEPEVLPEVPELPVLSWQWYFLSLTKCDSQVDAFFPTQCMRNTAKDSGCSDRVQKPSRFFMFLFVIQVV